MHASAAGLAKAASRIVDWRICCADAWQEQHWAMRKFTCPHGMWMLKSLHEIDIVLEVYGLEGPYLLTPLPCQYQSPPFL